MPNTQVVEVEVIRRPTTGQLVQLFGLNHVQAEHAAIATRELGRALHWHRFFEHRPQNLRVVRAHATEAGRRAAWSMLPYFVWAVLLPEAMKVDLIWSTFRDGWFSHGEMRCDVVIPKLPCDHTACDGKCDALRGGLS